MVDSFNTDEAKEHLTRKEKEKKKQLEEKRQTLLKHVTNVLQETFATSNVEAFLIGSITKPDSFSERSDIDIVLKNFDGDRFEVWAELERKIRHEIEIILYEKSRFQDHIDKHGLKVK